MNYTHSIYIEDKLRGHESEIFLKSFEAAAKKLHELHEWATDNGYTPTQYSLTLKEI
jgi:hypothetical protein